MGGACGTARVAPDDDADWNRVYEAAAADRLRRHKSASELQSATVDKDNMTIKRINQYKVRKMLGRGAFGEVLLGVAGKDRYAIKIMRKSALRKIRVGRMGSALDSIKTEIATMKKVRHPNCVQLFEVMVG